MMELLKKLTQTDGVSGNEAAVRDVIKNEIKKYCDEISIDAMGNIIAHKNGKGKRVMLAAHMDEIGVIATYTDDNGFIRVNAVGGLYTKDLVGRRVRFANGVVGVIGSEEEEFEKKPRLSKLYVDIGAKNKKEAEKYVNIGDTAVFCGEYYQKGSVIVSKALDNRTGCLVLIETMKKIKKNKNDLYFVFTSQEEVGLRGAGVAAYAVEPEYAIAVDVTDVGDTPNAPKMAVKLGGSAAIKVMDRSILCDAEVRNTLIAVAKENKIPYQMEIMTDGGTDAGTIHLSRSGVKTGGISVPTRYIHTPSELVSEEDIKACIELAAKAAEAF